LTESEQARRVIAVVRSRGARKRVRMAP
jgi:hypothetical protein